MLKVLRVLVVCSVLLTSGFAYSAIVSAGEEEGSAPRCSSDISCQDKTKCSSTVCSMYLQPWTQCTGTAPYRYCCLCPSGDPELD